MSPSRKNGQEKGRKSREEKYSNQAAEERNASPNVRWGNHGISDDPLFYNMSCNNRCLFF